LSKDLKNTVNGRIGLGMDIKLVGGFSPFEKYACQIIGSVPQG